MHMRLIPLLCDGGRYTSYGRHFTNTSILMEIVTRVIPFLAQGDLVVDCSCGANEWLEIMRNTCKLENLEVWEPVNVWCGASTVYNTIRNSRCSFWSHKRFVLSHPCNSKWWCICQIKCKGYDPFTPYYEEDWIRASWLDVTKEDLADGKHDPWRTRGLLNLSVYVTGSHMDCIPRQGFDWEVLRYFSTHSMVQYPSRCLPQYNL